MINPFNSGDRSIKVSNLRGNHIAKTVYCSKLIKHEGDVHYAWLTCDEVIEGLPADIAELEWEDRIYHGELHIRGIVGIDEVLEVEDDSED